MDPVTQNYANHRRTVFGFHILMGAIVLANLIYQVVQGVKAYSTPALFNIFVAAALSLGFWYMRSFPKVVQDRVIRLEETLRFQRLLPPDLQKRIGEFTVAQFVGLRFASDKELPALAKKVLDEKIEGRDAIKKLVTDWRPDTLRV
jgi:hypothetical protein